MMTPSTVLDAVETFVDPLERGLVPRVVAFDDARHEAIVRRVAAAFRAAKAAETSVPAEYRVAGEWASFLSERYRVYDALLADDVATAGELLRNFWRNELGPIVKEYARYDQLMGGDAAARARFQSEVTRNFHIWREMIRQDVSELRVPSVGNPWGLWIEEELIAPKATRFHALSTQVKELVRAHADPIVLEIGGGYGGMAYYLLRDCPNVTYVDLDLPETLALASYYLLATHPDRKFLLFGEDAVATGREDFRRFSAILWPNFTFPTIPSAFANVVVNTFSLSEVVWPTLAEYMRQIERTCRDFFLHHNMDRAGVVNRGSQRIPASRFPIDPDAFRLLYKHFDLFHGSAGDYRDFLYQRLGAQGGC